MSFIEFVAKRLNNTPKPTIDHKSMASFLSAVKDCEGLPAEELPGIWVAAMIDKDLADTSRKRYIEKIQTIHDEFCSEYGTDSISPEILNKLKNYKPKTSTRGQWSNPDRLLDTLPQDIKTHPELALFLYLLLNASSDIDRAIYLTTDEYAPTFIQLDDIIDTSTFHHRRKYIFDLGQSHKRLPQLRKETVWKIGAYLSDRGFSGSFTPESIVALWIAIARGAGIRPIDVRSVIDCVPAEYDHLRLISGIDLSPEEKLAIKRRVAEALIPSAERWYAMKLRRGSSFDDIRGHLNSNLSGCYDRIHFYYPTRVTSRRIGKRIIRETTPIIPDIVFFMLPQRYVGEVDKTVRHENLGWVYRLTNTPDSDYSMISRQSMMVFQKAVGSFTADMKVELTGRPTVGIGRQVRITGGVMEGYTGTIHDIKDAADGNGRTLYIRLSHQDYVKIEVRIDEIYIEPIGSCSLKHQ